MLLLFLVLLFLVLLFADGFVAVVVAVAVAAGIKIVYAIDHRIKPTSYHSDQSYKELLHRIVTCYVAIPISRGSY